MLKDRIESIDLSHNQFLDLLEAFADEKWKNKETYNSFIKGFSSEFENFSDQRSVRFISLLVMAGLN